MSRKRFQIFGQKAKSLINKGVARARRNLGGTAMTVQNKLGMEVKPKFKKPKTTTAKSKQQMIDYIDKIK